MTALQKYLTEYLLQCNKMELLAENIRQSLGSNPYFQIVSVFDRFDKFRKGFLEPADFSEFMLENQVYPTQGELYIIFKDFDRTKKGVVNLQQFQLQLLPRQNRKLRKTVLQRLPYPSGLKLQLDLEFLLAKYFQNKINAIGVLGDLTEKMKIAHPDAVSILFSYLDTRNALFIGSPRDIDNFLRANGKVLKNQELERIYRVLRFDREQEVTITTFTEQIDPLRLGCYSGYKQKMFEKETLQTRFLEKKYQVEHLKAHNYIQNERLHHQIVGLRQSNRRLRQIMQEQDLENYYESRKWLRY